MKSRRCFITMAVRESFVTHPDGRLFAVFSTTIHGHLAPSTQVQTRTFVMPVERLAQPSVS